MPRAIVPERFRANQLVQQTAVVQRDLAGTVVDVQATVDAIDGALVGGLVDTLQTTIDTLNATAADLTATAADLEDRVSTLEAAP